MLDVNEADAHMLKQVELTHYYFLKWDDVTLVIDDINSLLVDNLVRFFDFSKKDANTVFLSTITSRPTKASSWISKQLVGNPHIHV